MSQQARSRTVYLPPWRVDVVVREGVASPMRLAAIARAAAKALLAASAPTPGSVTVVLSDDDELSELNETHMGHAGPTDVLSFPMLEPESFRRSAKARVGARRPARAEQPARADPACRHGAGERRRTHIGDIAISVERAIEQAEEGRGGHTGDVRWSPADELRLLVTHGTLHLCGWDHAEPDEEAAMRAVERELLGIDVPRSATPF